MNWRQCSTLFKGWYLGRSTKGFPLTNPPAMCEAKRIVERIQFAIDCPRTRSLLKLSGNLADLFDQTLALADERGERASRTCIRIRNAFAEAVSTWKTPKTPARQVEALAKLALREVSAILKVGDGVDHCQATLLVAAVADLHYARGNGDVAERVFEALLSRNDHKPDFQRELNPRRNFP
jgi:hypothetical protein